MLKTTDRYVVTGKQQLENQFSNGFLRAVCSENCMYGLGKDCSDVGGFGALRWLALSTRNPNLFIVMQGKTK